MTEWQKPEAPLSRPSRLEGWLRRLLFSPAEQEWKPTPATSLSFDNSPAYGAFHWLNHAGPLSEDELRVLSFLSVGM